MNSEFWPHVRTACETASRLYSCTCLFKMRNSFCCVITPKSIFGGRMFACYRIARDFACICDYWQSRRGFCVSFLTPLCDARRGERGGIAVISTLHQTKYVCAVSAWLLRRRERNILKENRMLIFIFQDAVSRNNIYCMLLISVSTHPQYWL
jgi:hypothetical protein